MHHRIVIDMTTMMNINALEENQSVKPTVIAVDLSGTPEKLPIC